MHDVDTDAVQREDLKGLRAMRTHVVATIMMCIRKQCKSADVHPETMQKCRSEQFTYRMAHRGLRSTGSGRLDRQNISRGNMFQT